MSLPVLQAFAEIADQYDALLCDIWGVIHNGRAPYPGVVDALKAYRARGGLVALLSNVPKPRGPIPAQLARIGVDDHCFDTVITSGDAIRAVLGARAPGPFYRIGPDDDSPLWAGLGLAETRDMAQAAFVAISGLNDPSREHPDEYRDRLAPALARGLDLICANPDRVVRFGDKLYWCAGAVADVYAAMGGQVILAGKPHAPIYDIALAEVAQHRPGTPRSRILCIGDGLATDIAGANAQGLDALFIASGIHGEKLTRDGVLDPIAVQQALAADGLHARYAMTSLR